MRDLQGESTSSLSEDEVIKRVSALLDSKRVDHDDLKIYPWSPENKTNLDYDLLGHIGLVRYKSQGSIHVVS